MSSQTSVERYVKRRTIGKAIAVFTAVMLVLTFTSNTINNYLSPKVRYENPESGQLTKEISASGSVRAKKEIEKYVEGNMRISRLDVKVGDAVKKGEKLMELDTAEMEEQLEGELTVLQQKRLNVEKLKLKNSGDGFKNLENDAEAAKMDMEKTKKNYEDTKALFDIGAEAEVTVDNAQRDYEKARLDFENAQLSCQKAKEQKLKDEADNSFELENAQYELNLQEKKVQRMQADLKNGSITAPENGTIIELNFTEGAIADSSKAIYKIAQTSKGFQFSAAVANEAAKLLSVGDRSEIAIDNMNGYPIEGTICEIRDNQQERGVKKDIILDIPPENLIGGESGTMTVKKSSKAYEVLVSNSAVGQDMSGYFVYILKEQSGPLGNEYVTQKVKISVGESDDSQTVVLSGLNSSDMVVTGSDKPITDQAKVLPVEEEQ